LSLESRCCCGTTGNKAFAQEYHDKLKADLWRKSKLGEKPDRKWNEAVVRWLKEAGHKASIESDKMHLRWLDKFLRGKSLASITRTMIDRIAGAKKAEGVSNATANRVVEVLRAILRKAANDWEWLDKASAVRLLPEPTRRIRWLTRNEADRLLKELPPHLSDMAAFSLATNVTGLQWSQVDLVRRVAWGKRVAAPPVVLREFVQCWRFISHIDPCARETAFRQLSGGACEQFL
jgi:hypothetical protein